MSLKRFVDVKTVSDLLKKGIINKEGVRLLDCSFNVTPALDWKQYKKELYGKFPLLMSLPTPSKKTYLNGHIPEAVHFGLDVAMFPSEYQRFTLYPPEEFEEYGQLLGLNDGEHVILYGSGAFGGMMWPSRLAWLLKSYGHEKISIVDGGLAQWLKNGLEVSKDDVKLPRGNWKAHNQINKYIIDFEELEAKDGSDKQLIERTDEVNFLDARIRGQFNGTEDTGLDQYKVSGSHVPGFKSTPAAELVTSDGTIKSPKEIKEWLSTNGYVDGKPTITNCNTGMQASLLAYAMEGALPESKPRVYNGSLKELEARDPKKISAGHVHLPL